MRMKPSGLSWSLPNLAKTLFQERPTETESPSSVRTRSDISCATRAGSPPASPTEWVTSSQASSGPKGSTRSV